MACAVAEAVIDTIELESLMANVRQVSTYIRSSCVIGPILGVQGRAFYGLKTRGRQEVQAALLEKNILTGTSGDPPHPAVATGLYFERRPRRSTQRCAGEDLA